MHFLFNLFKYSVYLYVLCVEKNWHHVGVILDRVYIYCVQKKTPTYVFYYNSSISWWIFTCVSYAEARNRYRLDVCLSFRHTLVLYQNG